MNKRLIRNNCSKYLNPYFRNIVNTLNYSNATNRNEHAFQLLFVPLESIMSIMKKGSTHQSKVLLGHNRPLRKGCLKVLMGTLSCMVMVNTRHCKSCRTDNIFICSNTVLSTLPVIICEITGTPTWENTLVQIENKKSHS